ncbi:MAG: AraC family transcriptional regulator [Cytophagales bacterium]|nr:AraC family transcriptional regulator [Cytophagales bacterium]
MEITQFDRQKYGRELLIDCGKISENPHFFVTDNPFTVDFFEIFLILEGKGEFFLNEVSTQYEPGTVLFLPPGKIRQWGEQTETDVQYLIFEEEFIQRFFKDPLFLYRLEFFFFDKPFFLQLNPTENEFYQGLMRNIQTEIDSLRTDSDHLLRAFLYQGLIKLNRTFQAQHQLTDAHYDNSLALDFRMALEENYVQKHQVQDYCELLNISKTTLNSKIHAAFGKHAGDMIRERLVQEAKQQLMHSKEPVSQIAYDLQFNEVSNFNRLFRKLTGMSPGDFRSHFTN